jgi:tetratricopeptide (TPR) repeat protein
VWRPGACQQAFADVLGKDPLHALAIAELGVALAEAVSPDAYPPVITSQNLAHAWKDLGKAYRGLDRNEDSIEAFHRAETYLEGNGTLMHDLAIVRFNLGVTLQEVGRYDEALQLLNESKAVFHNHGDTKLLVFCGIAEGVLFQRPEAINPGKPPPNLWQTSGSTSSRSGPSRSETSAISDLRSRDREAVTQSSDDFLHHHHDRMPPLPIAGTRLFASGRNHRNSTHHQQGTEHSTHGSSSIPVLNRRLN